MSDTSSEGRLEDEPQEPQELYKILTNFPNYQMNYDGLMPTPNTTIGRMRLQTWLGRILRIKITDGRILVGSFACTDRDVNILLIKCKSYWVEGQDAQLLGTVMVPSKHIVSICIDALND